MSAREAFERAALSEQLTTVLSDDELEMLTGFKRPSKQATWLKANGFKFRLNAQLRPRVDRQHYLHRMGGVKTAHTSEPDWLAIKPENTK